HLNNEWARLNPARRSRNHYGVRGLVRAFGRRLVAVECGKASNSPRPLDASLLWRQVAKAAKAGTSHRTPNSCRLCAKFHHCSTNPFNSRGFVSIGGSTVRAVNCAPTWGAGAVSRNQELKKRR